MRRPAHDDLAKLFRRHQGTDTTAMTGLPSPFLPRGGAGGRRFTDGASEEGGLDELVLSRSSRVAIRYSKEPTSADTAADLVMQLEKAQKQYTLDRFLAQLERAHLLICDELGYVSLSRGRTELLFHVFAERYERASVLVTSNLPFGEWNQIFQGERMTVVLLDRLTHHCHIFEMNGESYHFRESMGQRKGRKWQ